MPVSFYADTPSGGTIVLIAVGLFVLASAGTAVRDRHRRSSRAAAADSDQIEAMSGGSKAAAEGDLGQTASK